MHVYEEHNKNYLYDKHIWDGCPPDVGSRVAIEKCRLHFASLATLRCIAMEQKHTFHVCWTGQAN